MLRDTWLPWSDRKKASIELQELIEQWGRRPFYLTGVGMALGVGALSVMYGPLAPATIVTAVPVALYWYCGLSDISQTQHTVLRNFPVLGHARYLLESIRPEIRQYFIETDNDANPISRAKRSLVYQRAKGARDSLPFGTRNDVYETGHEWANHSLYPKVASLENSRVLFGGPDCKQPYSASLLNISGMSYGAISDNAVLALNRAAAMGHFFHNTGEGGVSQFHKEPGGDLVWNVGTGYFGCRRKDGGFDAGRFKETAAHPTVRMIELKLSQGAKPAHGGILPASKVTPAIAAARGVSLGEDCNSPPAHTAFGGPHSMMEFIAKCRELSGGKPIGFKLCVGRPDELLALAHAMVETRIYPDFITVDGAEGGTGAAPLEFSDSIGMPLVEGLRLTHNALLGTGIRRHIKLIAAGRVVSGMSIVRTLALGADTVNAARAFMFALGCIQSLKCNTNKCPTGVTSQDPELMAGLVVGDKAERVLRYQQKTVHAALEIIGAIGLSSPKEIEAKHIFKRVSSTKVLSLEQQYPSIEEGSLLSGKSNSSPALQRWFETWGLHLQAHADYNKRTQGGVGRGY